ncbi:MAG: acyltransferase family protein [Acidimicrobiales bacterium]
MSSTQHTVPRPASAGYRGDIDGLRALSIIAVVLFHAGVSRVAGGYVGVDVFFVISGFLITGLLVREIERSGRVSMREFYARRIRRLLPLSFFTIIATLAGGMWLLPPVARESLVDDARAASLYVANWRYASKATAYSDTEVTDSLLVHFWSLAIEEQFYVLWPLLIIAGLGVARLLKQPTRRVLGVLLGTLGVASFAFSVVITNNEGVGAYYLTHTRLWEMAMGAGMALTMHKLPTLSRWGVEALGVGGLVLIAYAAMTFDESTPFPGSMALLPVVGCVAVLVAGSQGGGSVARVLATAPLRLIGRLSYAWYLVHWPSIGLLLLARERFDWGLGVGATTAFAVAASFGIAFVLHHAIENPVRHAHLLRDRSAPNFAMGAALTVAPLLFGALLISSVDRGDGPVIVASESGAIELVQTPAEALDDDTLASDSCHADIADTTPADGCVFGDTEGERTIVILGDSHARQWVDAIDEIGREEGWRVHAWTKSGCSIIDASIYLDSQERPYRECDEWREAVTDQVAEIGHVDLVVLARAAGYRNQIMNGGDVLAVEESPEHWHQAFSRTAETFTSLADDVVLLADTPWPGFSPPECLSERPADLTECSFPLQPAIRDLALLEVERPIADAFGVRIVDPVPLTCPDDPCAVVTDDGIITYRDSHHLTRTFTMSLLEDISAWLL